MDPISASAFNLHVEENARALIEEKQKAEQEFREIIVSCKSLSYYESKRFKSLIPQIFACFIAASFHIVVGIALAYSAILVPQLEAENSDIPVTKSQSSWIASLIVVAVPFGSMLGGFLMEAFGRLNTIKLAALPGMAGWTLIANATNIEMLIIGRLLTGLASALGTSPAIVYITEVARADLRGSLIAAAPTFASLGMVIAYLKGWYMSWRLVAWLCNIYTIVPAIMIFIIPESPIWLVSKGKVEEAAKSLAWINKYQPQPINKNETLAEMQLAALQKEHENKMSEQKNQDFTTRIKGFTKPTGYKPLLILMGLFFFQQFSGIYITLFYAVTFFEAVGSDVDAYLASILIGTVRLIMSVFNTWMLKRFKRRPLVMTSAAGMAICMAVSGLYTLWIHEKKTTLTWVPVVCIILYVVTSMIGLLTIPWTMTAELFPTEIRGLAHSVAYSIANLIMFASVQSYRDLSRLLGGSHGVQWFFAVVSVAGMIYAWIFLPETHGKKLIEIQQYFETNTIYLGQEKKKRKAALLKDTTKKPIVIASRVTDEDVKKAKVGQKEKMINSV